MDFLQAFLNMTPAERVQLRQQTKELAPADRMALEETILESDLSDSEDSESNVSSYLF